MKVTFIQPGMRRGRSSDAMQPLAFAVLAGLTPPDIEREYYDERIEDLPHDISADLIAIAVETFAAKRAYVLADDFRNRGIPVVLGGYHSTFMSEEALEHADAVIVGEAETVWQRLLLDFEAGQLRQIYQAATPVPLDSIQFDRSIFSGKKYLPIFPVQFSRGCRFSCDFCSIHAFYGEGIRHRPVAEVVGEIRQAGARKVFIIDDNIFCSREAARALFQALIPLRIKWGCQVSMDIADDEEMLQLMAESGCVATLIGFESLDANNLKQMNKGVNLLRTSYESAICRIKRHGIMIYGTFVFGYDWDTADSVNQVCNFALEQKLFLANFNPLMPMPGTKLFKRLSAGGGLIHDKWWLADDFRYGDAMLVPMKMTPQELTEACFAARKKFNRYELILKKGF